MSTVAIELDTTPPTLTYEVSATVLTPPEVWEVTITSDEEIGWALDLALVDSIGIRFPLGYVRAGNTIFVTVPTVFVWGGPATLEGFISDRVGNLAPISVEVLIVREVSFDADLSIEGAFDVMLTQDQAVEIETLAGRSFETNLGVDHAFEVEITMEAT